MAEKQNILAVDMGGRPAIVLARRHGEQQTIEMIAYRDRFLHSFSDAMGLTYEQMVASQGWDQPYLREQDDAAGPRRLDRVKRLIRKGGRRRMKRAWRLYRLVYGPYVSHARFSMMLMTARLGRMREAFVRATVASIDFTTALEDFGKIDLGKVRWKWPRAASIDPEIHDAR